MAGFKINGKGIKLRGCEAYYCDEGIVAEGEDLEIVNCRVGNIGNNKKQYNNVTNHTYSIMKLLKLSFLPTYLYLLMVTAFYGYNSYFNIPINNAIFSVQTPFLFFFDLSRIIIRVIKLFPFLAWLGLFVALVVIAWAIFFTRWGRHVVVAVIIIFLIYLPFGFYRFGTFLASISTNFYTTASSCIPGATDELYIAPSLYGDAQNIVFVPIDPVTHKVKNGLLKKDASSLGCPLERKEFGIISTT